MNPSAKATRGQAFDFACDSTDREQWLLMRRSSIGASESPAVLGVSTWASPISLWAEKTGRVERIDLSGSEPVFWGNELESAIISGYARRSGREVVPFGLMLRSRVYPWMTCTPDALVSETASRGDAMALTRDIASARGAVEDPREQVLATSRIAERIAAGKWWPLQIKNIGFASAAHWDDGVPLYYRVQCAHEALVVGSSRCTGAALVAGQRLAWEDVCVNASDALARQIIGATKHFFDTHIVGDAEPAADGSDSARHALAELYPSSRQGECIQLGREMMDAAMELDALRDSTKRSEKRIDEIVNTIIQAIGHAESAVFPDGSGYTLRTQKRKAVMTSESTFRVLRRTKAKDE